MRKTHHEIISKKEKPVKERGKKKERKEQNRIDRKRDKKCTESGKEKKGNIEIEIKINNVIC